MKTQQPQAGFAYSTGGGYNAVAGGYASPQPNYGAHTMAQPQAIPVAPPQVRVGTSKVCFSFLWCGDCWLFHDHTG